MTSKTNNLMRNLLIFLFPLLLQSCNDRGGFVILDKTYTVEYVDDERNLLGDGFTEKRETKEIKAANDSLAAENAYIGFLAKLKVMYKCHEEGSPYLTRPKFFYLYDENGNLVSRVKGEQRERLNNLVGAGVIEFYKQEINPYGFENATIVED